MSDPATGPVVIVTGGGRGIGGATARLMALRGWQVGVVDVDPDEAETVAASIRDKEGAAVALQADVAEASDWSRVLSRVHHELGAVSALVSNAAHNSIAPFDEISTESWRRHLDVNVTGAFLGVRACLDDLRQQRGSVVVVSSVHAAFGLPLHAAYATGKAALEGMTRQLASELGPHIRVNAVRPGPVLTDAWAAISAEDRAKTAATTLVGRLGEPAEVAESIVFLASPASSFITGTVLTVDGGWSVTKDSS